MDTENETPNVDLRTTAYTDGVKRLNAVIVEARVLIESGDESPDYNFLMSRKIFNEYLSEEDREILRSNPSAAVVMQERYPFPLTGSSACASIVIALRKAADELEAAGAKEDSNEIILMQDMIDRRVEAGGVEEEEEAAKLEAADEVAELAAEPESATSEPESTTEG